MDKRYQKLLEKREKLKQEISNYYGNDYVRHSYAHFRLNHIEEMIEKYQKKSKLQIIIEHIRKIKNQFRSMIKELRGENLDDIFWF